ncbi:hypothetical protein SEA_DELIAN_26 [Gordonia phage Delian]|nr:hypothetical protein SEA_DELIAN_26 [Gordonia phage Delian]
MSNDDAQTPKPYGLDDPTVLRLGKFLRNTPLSNNVRADPRTALGARRAGRLQLHPGPRVVGRGPRLRAARPLGGDPRPRRRRGRNRRG